ncbi:unnamed protein product [Brassica oleracea var. botrytis]|uniref:Uncharacterized protein n=1 Tax=Brassica oleracea TaxID=3712 RepID=A0A3P6FLE6_BRAOL|nr:unnamed protein product [Brassica oleracea]
MYSPKLRSHKKTLPVSKTLTTQLSPLALLLPPAAVYRRSFDIIHRAAKLFETPNHVRV